MTRLPFDPPNVPEQIAYRIRQAATLVGASRSRLRLAIAKGELAAYRDGIVIMVERAELERWIKAKPRVAADSKNNSQKMK